MTPASYLLRNAAHPQQGNGARVMKHTLSETTGGCVAKIAVPMLAFFLSAAPAISQTRVVDAAVAAPSTPAFKHQRE